MAYQYFNPNPQNLRVGDCVIRAISKATGASWREVFAALVTQAYRMADMPSSNAVWSAYLRNQGFVREVIPNTCPDCYTAEDFCNDYPEGVYILCFGGHVAAVEDGVLYDSFDSLGEVPQFYWRKEEE